VLDDVAASLDTVTEHHIGRALTGTGPLAHRTRLVVTHRASTASARAAVVWLDAGRVRGCGTHRELWAEAGYRAVFRPQPEEEGEEREKREEGEERDVGEAGPEPDPHADTRPEPRPGPEPEGGVR
jgi:ATP-binding cassette subfamily B protein